MSSRAYAYDRSGTIQWIGSHVLRCKLYAVVFVLAVPLTYFLGGLIPVYTGKAFSEIQASHGQFLNLARIALAALGVISFKFITETVSNWSIEIIAQRVKRDAREELYLNLLGKTQSFHNRQRVGDIMARAVNDARLLDYMLSPGIASAFSALVALITPIVFIALFRADLLLAPLLFLLMFGISVFHYVSRMHSVTVAMRDSFGELNAGLVETLSGIEVVKWSAQEERERENFVRNAARYRALFLRRSKMQATYLAPLCFGIALALGAVHSLVLMSQNQLALGEVIMYLGWLGLLQFPTTISESTIPVVQEGYVGATRMLNLIKEDIESVEDATESTMGMQGQVVFKDVSFAYNRKPVLKHISFEAKPGQTIAIVGPTGSGKTTLTRLLNRTYDVNSGQISVDGIELRAWSLKSLRSHIGSVEQDTFLFSKTIAENIAFGVKGPVQPAMIEEACKKAQAHEFITRLKDGYRTIVSEGGGTLSGGQRQRLAIARALLINPRILILDDSTSAVDSDTEEKIQKAVQEVMRGRTTFLITHRLAQIRQADRILVLSGGEIIDQGTHEELIERSGLYRRIYLRGRAGP